MKALSIVGPNSKNPPKMRLKKFVKLTSCNYTSNNATNFEYEAHSIYRDRKYKVDLLKLAREHSWNHIKWTYFWRVLAIWIPMWTASSIRLLYVQAVSGSKHYCRICVKIVNLFKFDPFLYRFDPFWTDLIHFWTDLIQSGPKKITLFMLMGQLWQHFFK